MTGPDETAARLAQMRHQIDDLRDQLAATRRASRQWEAESVALRMALQGLLDAWPERCFGWPEDDHYLADCPQVATRDYGRPLCDEHGAYEEATDLPGADAIRRAVAVLKGEP